MAPIIHCEVPPFAHALRSYVTRPALADERVQLNADGQVELKLKTVRRDGTTHLVMSPLKFMQRLASALCLEVQPIPALAAK